MIRSIRSTKTTKATTTTTIERPAIGETTTIERPAITETTTRQEIQSIIRPIISPTQPATVSNEIPTSVAVKPNESTTLTLQTQSTGLPSKGFIPTSNDSEKVEALNNESSSPSNPGPHPAFIASMVLFAIALFCGLGYFWYRKRRASRELSDLEAEETMPPKL